MKTSELHNIPVQAMNAIFDAIMRDTEMVFWLRTADHGPALYVSNHIKNIWKFSPEALYENPEHYEQFIVADDKIRQQNCVLARLANLNEAVHPINEFRIINSANETHWIHDTSFPVFDAQGNRIAIAGINESLDSQTSYTDQDNFYLERRNQLQHEIDTALAKEFKLRRKAPEIETNIIEADKIYLINDQEISLSHRQAQCLNGLLEGKSSKDIAEGLKLSIRTIDEYITNIRKKVDCHNRISLVNHFANMQD